MKPVDLKDISFVEYNEESNEKDPKFKVGDHFKSQELKIYLLNGVHLIGVKTFLLLKNERTPFLGHI